MKQIKLILLLVLLGVTSGCEPEPARYQKVELRFEDGRRDTIQVRVWATGRGVGLTQRGAFYNNGRILATGVQQFRILEEGRELQESNLK